VRQETHRTDEIVAERLAVSLDDVAFWSSGSPKRTLNDMTRSPALAARDSGLGSGVMALPWKTKANLERDFRLGKALGTPWLPHVIAAS